jgi:hypothetical protein
MKHVFFGIPGTLYVLLSDERREALHCNVDISQKCMITVIEVEMKSSKVLTIEPSDDEASSLTWQIGCSWPQGRQL